MKSAILYCASALAIACAAPALAQVNESGAEASGDIIVTAQRRAERTQDVPISITSIGADAIRQSNIQQLGDIARLSPATRFDYQANFVQPTIRGVGNAVVTAGAGSNVGIYTDGFYSPNPLAGDFQLLSVESIQVLKGPQGTLFGRNTTGGAILVTTSKPSEDLGGTGEISYGRFDAYQARGYITGGLAEGIAVDLEGSYARGDGWSRNTVPGPQSPGRYENWNVRAGVNFELSDRLSFLLRYAHQEVSDGRNVAAGTLLQDGRVYAPFQGLPEQLPSALVPTGYRDVAVNSASIPAFNFNGDVLQLTGDLDLDFATLTSYTQYRDERSVLNTDQDQTAADIAFNRVSVQDKTFTQEFLLASKPGGDLQWTAGLFYFNYIDQFNPVLVGINRDTFFARIRTHSRTQSIAAYLDLTYEIADKLFLTAGARYSHDRFDRGEFEFDLVGVNASYPALTNNRVTPRAVLRYEIDNNSSAYASYSRGYKAALIDVLSAANVKPESMDAFEVGYKYASRRFSLNLAAWYYDYSDLQVSVYEDNLSQVLNAATARIKGVEGDVRFAVTPDFEVTAGAAYLDAKYRSFPTGSRYDICADAAACGSNYGSFQLFPFDASGSSMQRAPKFTATLGARYGFDVGGGRATVSGNLYHTSSFYFDLAEQFRQDAYDLVGLRAEWTDPSDRFTLAVYGDNILNEKYYSQVIYHSPSIGTVWGAPRTWGVSARVKFGS